MEVARLAEGEWMPTSISAVLGSQPLELRSSAEAFYSTGVAMDEHMRTERGHLAAMAAAWTGTASDGAQVSAEEMLGDQQAYRDKLFAMYDELMSSSETLETHRQELSDLVTSGEAQFFEIADDGSVRAGAKLREWAGWWPNRQLEVKTRQVTLQSKIQLKLDQFNAADQAAAEALRRIDRG